MATPQGAIAARWPIGKRAPVRDYPVDSSATWESIGAVLLLDAEGELTEAAADPGTIVGLSLGMWPQFLPGHVEGGQLGRLISGTPATVIRPVDFETEYSIPYTGGPPTSANVGDLFGVVKDTDDIWKLDIAEVTATVFKITALDPRDDSDFVLSPNGRVFVKFDPDAAATFQS